MGNRSIDDLKREATSGDHGGLIWRCVDETGARRHFCQLCLVNGDVDATVLSLVGSSLAYQRIPCECCGIAIRDRLPVLVSFTVHLGFPLGLVLALLVDSVAGWTAPERDLTIALWRSGAPFSQVFWTGVGALDWFLLFCLVWFWAGTLSAIFRKRVMSTVRFR